MASTVLTVEALRDLPALETVRDAWKSWQQARDSDIDFFASLVRSRGSSCKPYVLVLLRNGKPDALMVGSQDQRRIPIRIGSLALFQPKLDVIEFVYGGLLGNGSRENCATLVQSLMQALKAREADLALWRHLDVDALLYTTATQLPHFFLRDHCRKRRDHWFLEYPKGLDAFLGQLGHSQRSKLRRKYSKFLKTFGGRICIRCFRTADELPSAFHDMEAIADNSLKRQLGFGFFSTPQNREQLLAEAALGWLRVYILYVDGKPISFWKGTLYQSCVQSDHVGFDSAWSTFSPGIFLFLSVIEDLRDLGVHTIDFGTGSGQFYESFARRRRSETRVQIFAPRFKALCFNLLQTVAHHLTQLIQRTSYLERPRKAFWRARKVAMERDSIERLAANP